MKWEKQLEKFLWIFTSDPMSENIFEYNHNIFLPAPKTESEIGNVAEKVHGKKLAAEIWYFFDSCNVFGSWFGGIFSRNWTKKCEKSRKKENLEKHAYRVKKLNAKKWGEIESGKGEKLTKTRNSGVKMTENSPARSGSNVWKRENLTEKNEE
jgi:hypothetical protein